jgi:hemolysin D
MALLNLNLDRVAAAPALIGRYAQVFFAAWKERKRLAPVERNALERQFLPAALEIIETPSAALPRAVMWTIIVAACLSLLWSFLGRIDLVAVAHGKIISADKAKTIQAPETAIVKAIKVRDGQKIKAGDVLVELEVAGTATASETQRLLEGLQSAKLEMARYESLALNASGANVQAAWFAPPGSPTKSAEAERRLMHSQYQEHRTRLASMAAELVRREAELSSATELVAKLVATAPIVKKRADDYKDLLKQNYVSQHGWLEREQARLEQDQDLAFQQSRVNELKAAIQEARVRKTMAISEFERAALANKLDAEKRASQLEQELAKARTRQMQQVLIAPVDGTVQQLNIHTIGGVVQPTQALMVIAPTEYQTEVEAFIENKDVGFIREGQAAEVKVETFPFTKYGTLQGVVSIVSQDGVPDEKRGLLFQARVKLKQNSLNIDGKTVSLSPGMNVTAEISTGQRRVIDYFLDTVKKTVNEGLRER